MAEITIKTDSKLPLYENLMQLDKNKLECNQSNHLFSHPADILRDNLEKIQNNLKKIINSKESLPYKDDKIEITKNYIFALDSFYDSLLLIIKKLTPQNGEDNKDAKQWLERVKPPAYKSFKDSTTKQHELIRKMANELKHGHSKINLLFVTNHKGVDVSGFYIATTIDNNDLVGASNNIHERYKDCSTAISYNHFILYSLGCIYNEIDQLNKSLFKNIKSKDKQKGYNMLYDILLSVVIIEEYFFPDEYHKPYINIKKFDDKIVVKYPHRYRLNKENVDNITSVRPHLEFNQRTSSVHSIMPYHKLIFSRS